jgi:type I restriction enzyme R subunit
MRLLIVVDKLLTGFDAPSATYLYIDKQMRDHGLFQAICRVNRLDGEDKQYGYIVDYKDLFKSIGRAYADYTSEALDGYDKEDVAGLLKDRLQNGREDLQHAIEAIRALCEPVEPPRGTTEYQHYFCAEAAGDPTALKANEPKRVALYKAVTRLVRAYGAIANELQEAGYSAAEAGVLKEEIRHYDKVAQEVKLGAGENIDYKAYEADMRYLLDTYIRADPSETVTSFDDASLVRLLADEGVQQLIGKLPTGIREDREAVAETIVNNTRNLIIDEKPINPKYYEKMSELLDALIEQRREEALDYEEYLAKLEMLAKQLVEPEQGGDYPDGIKTPAQRALFDNLGRDEELARAVDTAVVTARREGWRGHKMKEREVKGAIRKVINRDGAVADLDAVFELVKHQSDY